MMTEPVLIRKSPVVIIKNLLLLEFFSIGAYFVAGLLANYGALYQELTFSRVISYEIAKFLSLASAELLLIAFIFLRWYYAVYAVRPESITEERGIFIKRRKITPLERPWALSLQYGPLSQLFFYGAIIIRDKAQKNRMVLRHIPNPELYLGLIADMENEAALETSRNTALHPKKLDELLASRERENLEFKSSLRWDLQENKINKDLEKSAMKTAVAFLNSNGGHLVIGVDDSGIIRGLSADYATLRKPSSDGFENHFTNVFKEDIGAEFHRFVRVSFHALDQKEVCVMQILPASMPAYLRSENNEAFYIRTGNSTTALPISKAADYIRARWKK